MNAQSLTTQSHDDTRFCIAPLTRQLMSATGEDASHAAGHFLSSGKGMDRTTSRSSHGSHRRKRPFGSPTFSTEVRVWTRSAPEGDDGGKRDSRSVVAGQLVVAGGDATEVLEGIEGRVDAPAFAVAALVVADIPLAAALAWDDRRDAFSPQVGPEPTGVVALVGGQATDLDR